MWPMDEQLLLLVKEIHMAAQKLDISDLIATILDVGLMPHSIPSASTSAILPSILYRGSFAILYYPRDSIWAAPRDDLPHRIKQKIGTEKCLISIVWSVNGIYRLLDVLKGQRTIQRSSLMLSCPI
jgi:hypothetical protein